VGDLRYGETSTSEQVIEDLEATQHPQHIHCPALGTALGEAPGTCQAFREAGDEGNPVVLDLREDLPDLRIDGGQTRDLANEKVLGRPEAAADLKRSA
jgi:hypothetical protein